MLPIVLILGPTGGGKTSLSISLANMLVGGGECIGADSMQVYKGMDIGTAKPTMEEQAAAPHHLLDILDPAEDGFTVDNWLTRANEIIEDIRSRDRWPIVVGGTNLYVQSLLYGMFEAPACDPAKRATLESLSNTVLHARLHALDPAAAERIHINDRRRMVRAVEVCEETGEPLSVLQSQWGKPNPREDAVIIGLSWPVKAINQRINKRVKLMMDQGLLDEVRSLEGKLGRQASEALGYKQLLAHIRGECTLEEAVERIKILTRRYAKQQRTWLRRFRVLPKAHFVEININDMQNLANQVVAHITSSHPLPKET